MKSLKVDIYFLLILFVVALLYASVGHGGASGYLALMSISGFAAMSVKSSALILNLFVAGIAFIQFARRGYFRWQLLWPFLVTSVPMAFLGGMLKVDPLWYKRILGLLLILAVFRMLGVFGKGRQRPNSPIWVGLLAGGVIGFFSGLIGIGGGIVLSPFMLLMGWGNVKEVATCSAAFIWVNSLAGLIGLQIAGMFYVAEMWQYVAIALCGGFIGAYLGSIKMSFHVLKWCLSVVLLLASVKLIFL